MATASWTQLTTSPPHRQETAGTPPPLPRALIGSSQITPLIPKCKCHGGGGSGGAVGDTVSPSPQGTSVFVVVTKQILTENQEQGVCPEVWGHGVAWGAPVCPNPHTPLSAE